MAKVYQFAVVPKPGNYRRVMVVISRHAKRDVAIDRALKVDGNVLYCIDGFEQNQEISLGELHEGFSSGHFEVIPWE